MKTKLIIILLLIAFASCSTSKQGCPGANYQGPKHKSDKFSWYGS